MSISTSSNAVDDNGNLFVFARGSVSAVDKGFGVTNGNYQQVTAGNQITLEGIWQFANGSGQLQATEAMEYRVVTIGGAPPPAAIPSLLPISTSVVGVTPAGVPVVYAPPNAAPVPVGSSVAFSAWVPVPAEGTLPNTGMVIIDVPAGSPPLQAVNLVLIRPVTITPL